MSTTRSVARRDFLKSAAVTGAAAVCAEHSARAQQSAQNATPTPAPASAPALHESRSSRQRRSADDRSARGDFMVDVIDSNFEFIASNRIEFPRHHESIINYGGTRRRSSSRACTRNHRSPWRTATSRPKGADGGAVPRHRRHAARGDGDLQRLLRPRAGLHPRWQLARRDAAAAGRRVGAQRGTRPRWCATSSMGRPAGLAAAFRRVSDARTRSR